MFSRDTLVSYLNELFEVNVFSDYCPNGLQIEGKEHYSSVATAVSASLATIEAAIAKKAEILIVHHGLFWTRDSFVIEKTKRKKIYSLLQNEITLLAYHLPLDAHPLLGNNWKAARDLGWTDLHPFGPTSGRPIGVKGHIAPCAIDSFISQVEAYYGHAATVAKGGKKEIRTVALISGGAYKEVLTAASEGIDCFITGNFDEPAWNWAFEEKIHFLALGHAATEKVGPKALSEHLKQRFGCDAFFLDEENPF